MLLESNTNYLTKVGVWTTPTPKFTKSTIKTVYKLVTFSYIKVVYKFSLILYNSFIQS